MIKSSLLFTIALAIALPYSTVYAADDKAIKAQRRDAQKQRQLQKNERNRKNNEAIKIFHQYVRPLKKEYQGKSRDQETEFRLQQIDLKAEQNSRIAEIEADLQQSITQNMLNPQKDNSQQAVEKLKVDMKAHSNKMFDIKKQAAQEEHQAMIDNETHKHRLMSERDQKALDKAKSLGLLNKSMPIIAQPIGDGLVTQEQRWNEREHKNVEKQYNDNQRQLGEFTWGSKLRQWEIENKREDFTLKWQKKDELNALNSEQSYYSLLFTPAAGNSQTDPQEFTRRMSEIGKQTKLINIKYQTKQKKNRIKRAQEKRKIMGR